MNIRTVLTLQLRLLPSQAKEFQWLNHARRTVDPSALRATVASRNIEYAGIAKGHQMGNSPIWSEFQITQSGRCDVVQGVVGDLGYESTPKEQPKFASAQAQLAQQWESERKRWQLNRETSIAREREEKRMFCELQSRDSIYLNRVFA